MRISLIAIMLIAFQFGLGQTATAFQCEQSFSEEARTIVSKDGVSHSVKVSALTKRIPFDRAEPPHDWVTFLNTDKVVPDFDPAQDIIVGFAGGHEYIVTGRARFDGHWGVFQSYNVTQNPRISLGLAIRIRVGALKVQELESILLSNLNPPTFPGITCIDRAQRILDSAGIHLVGGAQIDPTKIYLNSLTRGFQDGAGKKFASDMFATRDTDLQKNYDDIGKSRYTVGVQFESEAAQLADADPAQFYGAVMHVLHIDPEFLIAVQNPNLRLKIAGVIKGELAKGNAYVAEVLKRYQSQIPELHN